ncbi:DUF916 and DUF3324 domain-containing protein [uncultured Vagococcus sp.]|uniref:DUF916 and DUF3324 domain-containing protein n=1 Tax=uncultured Vagococcus sp. TaxID=189676 RepID=UPI00258E6663|nr:DUF916 and DUF3324 domain-containing protein [uncultured Vagococcus sp.]
MTGKRKSLWILGIVGVCFLWMFGHTTKTEAAEKDKIPPKFNYQVVFPDNQMKEDIGYYHLKMKTGQKQQVKIEFTNLGEEKTSFDISLNSAKTNSNGVIEYGDTNIKNDDSLKFDFKEIVTAPKKLEVAAGETKELAIDIKMPDTSYDGIISGGIQIIQNGQNEVEENNGSMVLNEYAYVVGMILQETDTKVTPKLKLNTVLPGQSNYKNTLYVNYSNLEAEYVRNMTTEVQITQKGKSAVLFEKKQTNMKMAPNSFINFPVDMAGERMVAGDYSATILVTADEGINEKWTMDFSISQEEADKFNERDVNLTQETGINWKLIIVCVLALFVLFLLILRLIIIIKKRNKEQENNKKVHKKRKK